MLATLRSVAYTHQFHLYVWMMQTSPKWSVISVHTKFRTVTCVCFLFRIRMLFLFNQVCIRSIHNSDKLSILSMHSRLCTVMCQQQIKLCQSCSQKWGDSNGVLAMIDMFTTSRRESKSWNSTRTMIRLRGSEVSGADLRDVANP